MFFLSDFVYLVSQRKETITQPEVEYLRHHLLEEVVAALLHLPQPEFVNVTEDPGFFP